MATVEELRATLTQWQNLQVRVAQWSLSIDAQPTLITYSNASLIHEIDPQGNVVLSIEGGGSAFGYALWRQSLYGPPPDIGQ